MAGPRTERHCSLIPSLNARKTPASVRIVVQVRNLAPMVCMFIRSCVSVRGRVWHRQSFQGRLKHEICGLTNSCRSLYSTKKHLGCSQRSQLGTRKLLSSEPERPQGAALNAGVFSVPCHLSNWVDRGSRTNRTKVTSN